MATCLRLRRLRAPAAAIVAALACCACEGGTPSSNGGNPGGGGGGNDDDAPVAAIQFPPSGCLTDAAQVELSIAVVDETAVALVRVGGVPAVLGLDSLWRVSVPLQEGNNTIRVETRDSRGNSNSVAAQLSIRREGSLWVDPSAIAFDSLAGEALVLDPPQRALFGVQPFTGVRTLLTGPGIGSGPLFPDARDVDFLASRHAAVVTDGQLDAVILVDLTSGVRSTLSSPGIGGGPTPFDLHGIVVDEARNRALVVDDVRAELMAVDLSTGERSTVSADLVGSGPALIGPRRVALDLTRNRALVTVALSRAILAVDLASGNRTLFSGATAGAGPAFVSPFDLIVDPFRDRALVVDPDARAVFDVTLATGTRQIFSAAAVGAGPVWLRPAAVTLHLGGVPLVVDSGLDTLVQVGALSGDRLVLSGFTQGSGPELARPSSMTRGLSLPERFAAVDPTELLAIGVSNGARALLSGASRGNGFSFVDLVDVGVSGGIPASCLTVLDAGLPGVWDVQPSGDRLAISAPGLGSGPPFAGPRRMAIEPAPNLTGCALTALVVDQALLGPAAILRVDLHTGARTILSDATTGNGPELLRPVAIEIDAGLAVANVLDAQVPSILSVDLVTGDRTLVLTLPTLPGTPTDLAFDAPRNRFLVAVANPAVLLLADVRTRTTRVLADASVGAGPSFGRPVALELLPSATVGTIASAPIAYVLDAARGSILVVDTSTGDRVIQSK